MTRARTSILCLLLASAAGVVVPQLVRAQTQRSVQTAGGEVSIVADRFEQIGPDNLLVATGNVEVTRGQGRLLADRVEINRATGVAYQGEVHSAPYYRLTGERLERLGESTYRVQHGVFTTCEDEPPTWSFHLGEGTADLEDFVYGWNVSFWVKSLPIIPYFPFFAAAIRRERQTGFLPPLLGTSTTKGFYAEIPFFWAISDSQDATVSVNTYERRGFGGALEYRYILPKTKKASW